MRGSEEDKKVHYGWSEFEEDCIELASEIINSGRNFINVMGIRRGGIALAVRLADILRLPITNEPNLHTLVVDDIVDSGETRDHFAFFTFASLHVKPWAKTMPDFYLHTTEDWIVYPWEVEYE